jgi:hypothetical protein
MRLVPKDWRRLQHYKDRRPPWVKLHRSVLDDQSYMSLSIAARGFAALLWILASEHDDGEVDMAEKNLTFRLRLTQAEVRKLTEEVVAASLFVPAASEDASNVLADACTAQADATRSTLLSLSSEPLLSSEAEEPKKARVILTSADCPEDVDQETWDSYLAMRKKKNSVLTTTALGFMRVQGQNVDMSLIEVLGECIERNWLGFKADWILNERAKQNGRSGR